MNHNLSLSHDAYHQAVTVIIIIIFTRDHVVIVPGAVVIPVGVYHK